MESLDRTAILRCIPHQSRMCLIDAVTYWDARQIICLSTSHRSPEHPLRQHGQLFSICGIEYGAQAMAIHHHVTQASHAQKGYLISAKYIRIHTPILDHIPAPLHTRATLQLADAELSMYRFEVSTEEQLHIEGQLTAFLR